MRRLLVAGAVAAALWAPAAGAAPPVSLPWPPEVLPRTPPLAPETSGALPLPPRFVRGLDNRERVVVGIDEDGKPHSVRVLQTIVLKRLGDYVLTVPAPVLSVTPGPGTESQPGRRENQILWEGFSPGRRVLAAWADLRLAESVAGLPVEVKVEPGAVTVRNATGVTVPSFTAEPDPVSLGQVSGRVRSSIKADVFPEGLNVGLRGKQDAGAAARGGAASRARNRARRAASASRSRASSTESADRSFACRSRRGSPRSRSRFGPMTSSSRAARRARATCSRRRSRSSSRTRGSGSSTSSSPARTRQGRARRRTSTGQPRRGRSAEPAATSGDEDNTVGWIVLGLGLAAALPVAAVVWAHS